MSRTRLDEIVDDEVTVHGPVPHYACWPECRAGALRIAERAFRHGVERQQEDSLRISIAFGDPCVKVSSVQPAPAGSAAGTADEPEARRADARSEEKYVPDPCVDANCSRLKRGSAHDKGDFGCRINAEEKPDPLKAAIEFWTQMTAPWSWHPSWCHRRGVQRRKGERDRRKGVSSCDSPGCCTDSRRSGTDRRKP